MNPQYLPPQQYGAPNQSFQNNQGFQSVPLAPPKNGPPTSVSSASLGPSLNNLLGKMPSGNLNPVTLIPQGDNILGSNTQISTEHKQSVSNNMDGGPPKPALDIESNGSSKILSPQIQNGPSQNGVNPEGLPIPPSQLPSSTAQSRPVGSSIGQSHSIMPPMSQNRSSPNPQIPSRPSPSFTPSSQMSQVGPPPTTSQSYTNSFGQSSNVTNSVPQSEGAPPSSSFSGASTASFSDIGRQQSSPFGAQPMSRSAQQPSPGAPQNQPPQITSSSSTQLAQIRMNSSEQQFGDSFPNTPLLQSAQRNPSQSQGGMQYQKGGNMGQGLSSSGQHQTTGTTQVLGQSQISGPQSMSGQLSMQVKPPTIGQPSMLRQPPVPGQSATFGQPGQPPMPGQLFPSGQPPMSGVQPPMLGQQPPSGQQPLATGQKQPTPGQQQPPTPGQHPPMPGQQIPMPGQQPLIPGQQPSMPRQQPPMPGQQPPMPGQQPPMPGQQPPMPGQQPPMPGQQPPMPGQQPPMPAQRPPMSAQQFPLLGQQSLMSEQLPPMPAQQPPIPGQQPPIPGQQPPMPGQQFPLPSQQSLMPGQQPPMAGQLPPMSGAKPPMSVQQPTMPGQQSPMLGQQFMTGQQPLMSRQPPISAAQSGMPGQTSVLGQSALPGQNMPRQPYGTPSFQSPPPMPGQLQSSYGQSVQMGQSQLPTKQNIPPQPYGQPPPPGHPGMPPPTNNSQSPGFNQMSPNSSYNSPQYSNQLHNQMQNMNLSGSKQYPGPSQKGSINGDGPHMPPPQIRSPVGYPPMPGQQHSMTPGQAAYGQQQGYPPQPGYPQQPGYQQQAQQRRLDPDQMPSPIQVTTDDRNNRSGVFVTNQKGLVPPLVTTDFVVQDQGNASPRFIRSTMYNVPVSHDIMKQTAVPFSLVVSPMARMIEGEYPPPIVNFGDLGPVRCVRCKAYMCPFMNFVDSGRRFQCAFCKATTDVPAEYFQHLDHTGQRMDRYERPELVLGTYEFIATADYCRDNVLPKAPAVIFVIDVSYNSIKSGLVHLLCTQMKEIIQNLPVDQGHEKSNMKVGFITYDSSVHFYNIKGTLAAPQMLVVGDTHEMFMPLLDGFLCTPEESGEIIDSLMEQIPTMFGNTRETETILLPAILAGMEALKASGCAGKLMVFNTSLPSAEAPGKLKNRDDRKLLGTDKERTILTPQNQAYNQLGQDCVQVGCSVDLFIFNNAYIDIATIGQVSRLTGGEVFKYTYFQADLDGERLIGDIIMDISRPIAFDAIMRVRTSTGIRPTDFYGHFYMSNTTDIELASIDCDKAIALEIKHDDKLQEDEGVYIQSALLYTSCSGQRRLRICNLSLKTCSQMADLYRSCDLDTIINYYSKQCIFKLMDNNPKAVKDAIVSRAAQTLATYRKNCASPSSAGQLILPECMKLLPLYVNCLLKSDALNGGSEMTVDDRSFVMQAVMTMDVPTSVHYFYPRLMPLHELDLTNEIALPDPIRCSIEKMSDQGIYILENGIHLFLWIGLGVSQDIIQKLFGVQAAIQVNIEQIRLPELDNPLSLAVRQIIEDIRIQRHRNMRLTLVRQREKIEPVFKHFLVEDRGVDGSPSYVDFLCHMHKEIRNLLS